MWIESEGNVIKMYGQIWDGDGAYLTSNLLRAIGKNKEVTIHLHTPGGSVIDGNLIYNTLKNADVKINMIIDGVAASMGSIIMLAGDTISIAENALLMIHAPSGSARGTSKDLSNVSKLLDTLEKNFIKKYTTKSNLTEEVVKGWLSGDNWFSAEEALEAGLVDAIIEPVLDDDDLSMLTPNMKMTALFSEFQVFNEKPKEETPHKKTKNKNEDNMKLSAKSLTVLGLSNDAPENEVDQAIEALNQKNISLEANIKANNEAKVKALIDGAVKSGKIKENLRPTYTALAEKDFDLAEATLRTLPDAQKLPSANPEGKSDLPQGREGWTKKEWKTKDMSGLLAMKKDNPDAYWEIINS